MKPARNVKGILFADYVRMMRWHKGVDFARHLREGDLRYLEDRVEPSRWYPMDAFERLGEAILHEIARGDMASVRAWGRASASTLVASGPDLLCEGDPVETLMRFKVYRDTFFDFEALRIPTLTEDHADVVVHYHMGPLAEEAACHQTLGFFEGLIERAGGTAIEGALAERAWAGDARTRLELDWRLGARPSSYPR